MSMPDKILAKKMKKKELKKRKLLLEKQAKEAEVLKDSTEGEEEVEEGDIASLESETKQLSPPTAKKHKLATEEATEEAPVKKKKKKKEKIAKEDSTLRMWIRWIIPVTGVSSFFEGGAEM